MSAEQIINDLITNSGHHEHCTKTRHTFQQCSCGRFEAIQAAKRFLGSQSAEKTEAQNHLSEELAIAQVQNARMRHALQILLSAAEEKSNFFLKMQNVELPWIKIHGEKSLQYSTVIELYSAILALMNPENWSVSPDGRYTWNLKISPVELLKKSMGDRDGTDIYAELERQAL